MMMFSHRPHQHWHKLSFDHLECNVSNYLTYWLRHGHPNNNDIHMVLSKGEYLEKFARAPDLNPDRTQSGYSLVNDQLWMLIRMLISSNDVLDLQHLWPIPRTVARKCTCKHMTCIFLFSFPPPCDGSNSARHRLLAYILCSMYASLLMWRSTFIIYEASGKGRKSDAGP